MSEKALSFKIIDKACQLFAGDSCGLTTEEIIKFFCEKLNVEPEDLNPQPEGYRKDIFRNLLLKFSRYDQKEILLELCEKERPNAFRPSWPSKGERHELVLLLQNEFVDKCEAVEILIFAAKEKPDINIANIPMNKLSIPRNDDLYLIYEPTKTIESLLWRDLLNWWDQTLELDKSIDLITKERNLYIRLAESLNEREKKLLKFYFKHFRERLGEKFPALIPQVWLHYNRYSNEYRKKTTGQVPFFRQVIDFLLILQNNICVVIEIDGKEHYSSNGTANEELYASQVSYDRDLKLLYNYDVYRFGNYELDSENAESTVVEFFEKLLINKYKIKRDTDNDLK